MSAEKVDIQVLKKLRAMTGAGIGECKQALLESKGDIELAQKFLADLAKIKAKKKSLRPTSEGRFAVAINEDKTIGCVIEVRCETDFVSRHESFQAAASAWAKKGLELALKNNNASLEQLKELLEEERVGLVQQTDENVEISQFCLVFGKALSVYEHGNGKICLVADLEHSVQTELLNENSNIMVAQLALGSGPEFWVNENAENFSVKFKNFSEQSSELKNQDNKWMQDSLFSNESVVLGDWMDKIKLIVQGYVRFTFAASAQDLGQKFSDDVQALLSKYEKNS